MSVWIGLALASLMMTEQSPAAPEPPPEEPEADHNPSDLEPNPDLEPDLDRDPQPPVNVPPPVWPEDPPREPPPPGRPPEPEPPPREPPAGGGGGSGGVEPQPPRDPLADPVEPKPEVRAAPFADFDVADRGSQLDLGGDLTFGPICPDDDLDFDEEIPDDEVLTFICNSYRLGLRARLPVTQSSTSGSGRAAIDSLNGFAGAWRLSALFDWVHDVTSDSSDAPSKFYMLSFEGGWGVQTFRFNPNGGADQSAHTRHSIHAGARFLAYIHPPRKTRVAPQVLLRYDRQWQNADAVGLLFDDGDASTPAFTVPQIIEGPVTRPAFAVTVPVLLSIQSARGRVGKVLSQLGFGPAVSYAAAGREQGYNPFDDVHVLRLETWLYWYPVGKAGELATSKTNVRVGISPLFDVFLGGREVGEPRIDYGLLAEIKLGVRGYEY